MDLSHPELYLFSSDYLHVEGTSDPIGRFERFLSDRDEHLKSLFYSENFFKTLSNIGGCCDCMKTEIPEEICNIDDELKAIYHSNDCVCIWVFKNREDRNRFMDETVGMLKEEREEYFRLFTKQQLSVMKNTTYEVKKSEALLKKAKEVIPGGIFGHYKYAIRDTGPKFFSHY